MIVNPTNPELNLSYGFVSNAIVKQGGVEIQEELKRNYPTKIKIAEIVSSSAGKLPMKRIFHGALPDYNDKGIQVEV